VPDDDRVGVDSTPLRFAPDYQRAGSQPWRRQLAWHDV